MRAQALQAGRVALSPVEPGLNPLISRRELRGALALIGLATFLSGPIQPRKAIVEAFVAEQFERHRYGKQSAAIRRRQREGVGVNGW